jgi:hypothetical protein
MGDARILVDQEEIANMIKFSELLNNSHGSRDNVAQVLNKKTVTVEQFIFIS